MDGYVYFGVFSGMLLGYNGLWVLLVICGLVLFVCDFGYWIFYSSVLSFDFDVDVVYCLRCTFILSL